VTGLRGRASIAGGALIIAALGGFALPAVTTTAPALAATTPAQGVDVSSFQHTTAMPTIDWPGIASSGVSFTGVKASEGNYYTNPYYAGNVAKNYEADAQQAVNAGLYVTPYIFANPHAGNGTAAQQADYGAAVIKASTSPAYSGSHMLPVTLDIEPNPYANSNQCYGLTQSAMQTWISQFMTEIKKDLPTSKVPIIYTTADWWNACTGNDTAFSTYPLWLASYGVTNPALPAGWNNYAIWQYGQGTVDGISGVDQDELGPVLQVAQAGTAIGTVRLRTLSSLAGQAVTYSAAGLPPGLSISSSSGLISGTPITAGTYSVTVTATDTTGASGSAVFSWMVSPAGGGTCQVVYSTTSQWPGGFTANITITNTGSSALSSWTLKFTFPGDQHITNAWNGTASQSGENVTIINASYNGTIAPGGSTSVGFQGTWTSSDAAPTAFTLNGGNCTT